MGKEKVCLHYDVTLMHVNLINLPILAALISLNLLAKQRTLKPSFSLGRMVSSNFLTVYISESDVNLLSGRVHMYL